MKFIEQQLDRHTMYQVVIAILGVWALIALVASAAGYLPYTPFDLLAAAAVVAIVSGVSHYAFAYLTKAPANIGSTVITAFILWFILEPSVETAPLLGLAAASLVAIASKYVIAYRHLHILNPAALAAVVAGVVGFSFVNWWIGAPVMALFVLIGGLLIAAKIRRFLLVGTTFFVATACFVLLAHSDGYLSVEVLKTYILSTPILFFILVMVTEPLSTPAGNKAQILYGAFIGFCYHAAFAVGPVFNSPELTLVIANLLAYPFSLRSRLSLVLEEVKTVAKNTLEFSFSSKYPFTFLPGQYLEWALPHPSPDARGTRRYFTIASAPSEEQVKLTVRTSEEGSTFKTALQAMKPGDTIHATARNGEFVLPKDLTDQKFLFISGGIGVTPFRSQVKSLIDTETKTDAVHFYCNKQEDDIAYHDLFNEAESVGVRTIDVLSDAGESWGGETGFIDLEMLKRHAPNFIDRKAYISGPPGMVGAYSKLLKENGVPARNIITDYFPGLA